MDRKRWLWAPDLALLGSAVTLAYCLFVFDAPRRLFRDSDTGWHIRTGERIVAGRALPSSDPYSFSRAGQPWLAWEWGADALMGAAHAWDGLSGVALLYALPIAACTWLWFRLHWAAGGDFLIACAMASPMLSTVNLHWLARPHVFSWVLLLAWLIAAERAPPRFTPRHAAAVGALAMLWANVHASFFLLPALAAMSAACWWIRPALWGTKPDSDRRRARWFLMAAGCAAAATLCNPYGWRLHAHVLAYLSNQELLSRVGEFQSFQFQSEGSLPLAAMLAAGAVGATLSLLRARPDHFLIAGLFLVLGLRSARALPLAALIALPYANGAIAAALRRAVHLPRLQRALDYSARLRAMETGFRGYAWMPLLAAAACLSLRLPAVQERTGFPPEEFPAAAESALSKIPVEARILAPDKYGGYLIYRYAGARKVFFDGRSDFYGAEFMKEYIRLVQVRPGWREQLDAHRFTHALLPADYSLAPALEQLGWRTLHRDRVSVLLERPAD